jgi:hypothetical protein
VSNQGTGFLPRSLSERYGTQQASRLSWLAHYGKKLDSKTQLVRSCGDPKCINPLHLREATPNDLWFDLDPRNEVRMPPAYLRGSVGALRVGKRTYSAQDVYNLQSTDYRPPRDDPSKGLRWVFYYQLSWPAPYGTPLLHSAQAELDRIRAIRRCPIRATRNVLPSGFIRYDLPPGLTEITFTEPPEEYTPLHSVDDDDEAPESAPAADWALAA